MSGRALLPCLGRQAGDPLPQRGVVLQRLLEQRDLIIDAVAQNVRISL